MLRRLEKCQPKQRRLSASHLVSLLTRCCFSAHCIKPDVTDLCRSEVVYVLFDSHTRKKLCSLCKYMKRFPASRSFMTSLLVPTPLVPAFASPHCNGNGKTCPAGFWSHNRGWIELTHCDYVPVILSVVACSCSSQHCGQQWLTGFNGQTASVTQQERLFCCHSQTSALNISRWIKWLSRFITSVFPFLCLSCSPYFLCVCYNYISIAPNILWVILQMHAGKGFWTKRCFIYGWTRWRMEICCIEL